MLATESTLSNGMFSILLADHADVLIDGLFALPCDSKCLAVKDIAATETEEEWSVSPIFFGWLYG